MSEKPDVPKDQTKRIIDLARHYCDTLRRNYLLYLTGAEVASIHADIREACYQGYELAKKELADLRAELLEAQHQASELNIQRVAAEAERDKLKEQLVDETKSSYEMVQELKADNERMKAANALLKNLTITDGQMDKLHETMKEVFTSELQRRWPSEDELPKINPDEESLIAWLKSYLENK